MSRAARGRLADHSAGRTARKPGPDLAPLIERVADGDQAAFEEVYRRTAGSVYALVRRILPDATTSAEITQDIYVRVWGSAHSYRQALGSAETWLFALTHSCAVDHLRNSADSRRHSLGTGPDAPPLLPTIADHAAQHSLSLLTPEQAEALELAYFCGLDHRESARALGVDQPTFRLRVRTALSRLRQGMESHARRRGRRIAEH